MKKVVRLTESDLVRIVKRVVKEESSPKEKGKDLYTLLHSLRNSINDEDKKEALSKLEDVLSIVRDMEDKPKSKRKVNEQSETQVVPPKKEGDTIKLDDGSILKKGGTYEMKNDKTKKIHFIRIEKIILRNDNTIDYIIANIDNFKTYELSLTRNDEGKHFGIRGNNELGSFYPAGKFLKNRGDQSVQPIQSNSNP